MTLNEAFAQGVTPKRGGTLTSILTPEPAGLILGIHNATPTSIAGSKMYQSLLKFSQKLEPLPELAKSWELSPDKRTYTFKLQENVFWHDGKPFSADDVIFSIMKFHLEMAPRLRTVFSKIQEASAPDPLTVKITLDAPFEPFLLSFEVTTCPIMPKHIYDGTDYRNNPANQKPVGTGPFQFAEWQRGNFIRLTRFEKYWKPGQPFLDEIIYRIIPDSQSRSLALQTGQVQLTQESDIEPFDIERFRKQSNLEVTADGWQFYSPLSWIEINHRLPRLSDRRVRQAMSYAIDREFIVNKLWFGIGRPAYGPIASTTRFFDKSLKQLTYDPRAAAQLLDAADLKPNAQGIRFTIKNMILPFGEVWTRLAEYIRTAFRQIGIEVIIEPADLGTYSQRLANWDYETTVNQLFQFGDPTLGVERSYHSANIKKITFTNTGGYSNPKVDQLFDRARVEANAADRQATFNEVQKILIEDIPQIWIMELSFPTIYDKRVHNAIQFATGTRASFDDVFIA